MDNHKDELVTTEASNTDSQVLEVHEENDIDLDNIRDKKPSFIQRINFKKVIKYIIILAVIVVGILYLRNRFMTNRETAQDSVQTEAAVIGDIKMELSGKGTVEPLDQYKVTTLVKGEVLNAPFEEGDKVKKGNLLFQISTKDVENSIKSAELSVKRAKKTYNDTVDGLTDLTVKTKVSGYLKEVHIEKGDTIQPGTVIAEVYDDSRMLLDIPFPAEQVNSSWVGKKAVIEIDGSLEDITGKIKEIHQFEEVLPGNIIARKVTIQVTNPGGITSQTTATASVGEVDCNDYGTFRPLVEDQIISDKTGEVASINLKKGNYVKKGTIIIKLSRKSIDTQIENSQIGIEESQLALDNQKSQLENYRIEAPISGQVILKNKKAGDTIDPQDGTGPLAIIYDLSALTFKMSIDELDIMSIKEGGEVTITADAIPDEVFMGVVENISLNSTTINGVTSYPVLVRIDKVGSLLPGMNVTGRIITKQSNNVIIIPASSVMRGDYVYVKDPNYVAEDSKKPTKTKLSDNVQEAENDVPEGFHKVKVEVGLSDGAYVEVISGIKENDEVYIPPIEPSAVMDGMMFGTSGGVEADVYEEE